MEMLVLKSEEIYQGNLILVNRNYPVRYRIGEQDLRPVFENQPEICMERESAQRLQKLLKKLSAVEVNRDKAKRRNDRNNGHEYGNVNVVERNPEIVGVSGYRTREEQVEIFEDSFKENGREFTEKYVAFPDHSEHQTGLAIDLAENRKEIDFICPEFPCEGICQRFRGRRLENRRWIAVNSTWRGSRGRCPAGKMQKNAASQRDAALFVCYRRHVSQWAQAAQLPQVQPDFRRFLTWRRAAAPQNTKIGRASCRERV